MSVLRHTIHVNFGFGDDPDPKGEIAMRTLVSLDLDDDISLLGGVTPTSAAWLRKLATEADNLADAIEAQLAGNVTPIRLAESTAGEARDVPTPGGAV